MKTLTRLLFAAALAGAAASVLARLRRSRATPVPAPSDNQTTNTEDAVQSAPLGNGEPLRVPLGELLEVQGTRLS